MFTSNNNNKKLLIAILASVITSMIFMNTGNIAPAKAQGGGNQTGGTVVRDSITLHLSGYIIPGESFIHLYDSSPYQIVNGHVAAKIPCDDDSNSILTILTGSAPVFQPAELELIQNLSAPGELCLYHVDLPQPGVNVTTDLAIQNPTDSAVDFPETSTVVVGINEIMPGAEEHG
jgi:hypothetical protein